MCGEDLRDSAVQTISDFNETLCSSDMAKFEPVISVTSNCDQSTLEELQDFIDSSFQRTLPRTNNDELSMDAFSSSTPQHVRSANI